MQFQVRQATADDAEDLSRVLRALAAAGTRRKPSDPAFARDHYILHPTQLWCSVCHSLDGRVLGFQSLKRADAGNAYGTPVGWGIIGTHVRPDAARCGVGRSLFAATHDAARRHALPAIEAFIASKNAEARAFYGALGFEPYRPVEGVDCRRILLPPD